ncbi:MAG: ATP-binding protein [Kofleriaceae bacterium]
MRFLDLDPMWLAIAAAADQVELGVFVAKLDATPPRMEFVSERIARMVGRPHAELLGATPWAILQPHDAERIQGLIAQRERAEPIRVEIDVVRPDGVVVPIEVGVARVTTATELLSFGYFRDLTNERHTVEALRQSEQRFRFLVEAAPDGVVILKAGKIVFMNPRAALLLGTGTIEASLGRSIAEFLPPEDARATAERIATMFRTGGEMAPNEYGVLGHPDRTVEIKSIRCTWEGGPAVLAFARDVTERKAMHRKLVEADRLAALGTLAAGVAHEINNPLAFAQLSLQLSLKLIEHELATTHDLALLREHLAGVQTGIDRVAAITQGLRTFARADDAPPGPVDVTAVVESALRMVDTDLRHRAQLVRRFADVPLARGNASRLEQVFVNLLLNALQALSPDEARREEIEVAIEASSGGVAIAIRDTGHGIAPHIMPRLFDPFFTTKRIGEGMGLGLAVSKGIVEGFGGTIDITSVQDRGTTVTIRLPAHVPAERPLPVASATPPTPARLRILVIDDEPLVRNALARALATDHEATTADGGEEALVAVAKDTFDVILCDMMMPGMSGREVYRRIARDHPGLERTIIFITGGTLAADLDAFLASTGAACLMKPFRLEQLIDMIARVARDRTSV